MNKSFWLTTALMGLSISALTLVYGQGYLTQNSIIVFTVLTLLVPILVRKWGRWDFLRDYPMSPWLHTYAWLWWSLFFNIRAGGVVTLSIDPTNRLAIGALWFAVYMLVVILIELTALLCTLIMKREQNHGIWDDIINMEFYALPIPALLMGTTLYSDGRTLALIQGGEEAIKTLLAYINLSIFITVIIHMLVFALYLYPRDLQHKFWRLVRIFITAMGWLAIMAHIIGGGYMPQFIIEYVTSIIFRNNIMVYVLTISVEFFALAIAVLFGYYIEVRLVEKLGNFKQLKQSK